MSDKRFAGKVVLVTGSVRNTGREIAKAFLEEGADVWVNGRSMEKFNAAKEYLAEAAKIGGGKILPAICDVCDTASIPAMFAEIKKTSGRLDVLVNNAVVQGMGGGIHEFSLEEFDKVIHTNIYGYYFCAQEAAKMMIAQKGGAIVNMGSNTAMRATRNRSAYCCTKGAIDSLNRAMALDLAPFGIQVNSVVPGYIYTDRWDVLDQNVAKHRRDNTPSGRESAGRDIANAVLFMASPAARNCCGSNLVVDGGCSIQLMPKNEDM